MYIYYNAKRHSNPIVSAKLNGFIAPLKNQNLAIIMKRRYTLSTVHLSMFLYQWLHVSLISRTIIAVHIHVTVESKLQYVDLKTEN